MIKKRFRSGNECPRRLLPAPDLRRGFTVILPDLKKRFRSGRITVLVHDLDSIRFD